MLSNLIHSLCEGIHAVRVPSGTPRVGGCLCSCHDDCSVCCGGRTSVCSLAQHHMVESETTILFVCGVRHEECICFVLCIISYF